MPIIAQFLKMEGIEEHAKRLKESVSQIHKIGKSILE